jgi:environmental stress-induced protein Ves
VAKTEVRQLKAAASRRATWKNGRGATEELALWPDEASFERGDFDWRISKAQVDEAGAFSSFPGFERLLLVVSGVGLVLEHGELAPRAHLRAMQPLRFSGDWPTRCELPHGPIQDFNVLTRKGVCSAELLAVHLGARRLREAHESRQAFVHALGGALSVRVSGEEQTFELEAGDSLLVNHGGASDEFDLLGRHDDSKLVLVRFDYAAE